MVVVAEAVVVVVDRVVVVGTKNYSNKKRPDLSGLFFHLTEFKLNLRYSGMH